MTTNLLVPFEHVVFTELDGQESVLVDLTAKRYYTLNETASFIWSRLEEKKAPAEIARELTEAYEVEPERAAASVEKLLGDLTTRKLVTAR
jgi:hypothetical protein